MTPLSLAHLTVLDVAPPDLFDLAAEAGFQNVGIRILPAAPGAVSYPLSAATVPAWRRRMADAGVGIHDVEFIPLTPEVRLWEFAPALGLAAELGARRINVSGDDADAGRLVDRFGALCDLAASVGLGVDLEFMRFRIVGTLPQALAIVKRAGRANGRLLIDVLHLFRSGGTAEMLREVPASALGSVQLCDAPRKDPTDAGIVAEAREGRLFPGEGELPLKAFMDALPRDIPVGVEVPTGSTHPALGHAERAARACAATRELLASWQPSR
ncbi:sugar phosphate isomerase/epimerase [Dolichospermum sp. ST_sed1]|jgi:sugar phosphate isomerase/epimerase|uniref:sugar phosphate isomerase/epimerase family protein n=1 Tax=unclassified Variovorax TaxID=663243 RepID=UPI000F7F1553|nr:MULTISPECIES: TIM barrel protein [unclassified Variovorax]MDD1422615.1 sugar phosphate isomerase/epimerase [Dolichospermum sp. ST_sed1]RSZ43963.1 sugar phosphate isomerase/epimerase [Variovorax sp. 553]RSZ45383.1 sugar phosphate isomerase/epimerase [Variovorax sp. 679]